MDSISWIFLVGFFVVVWNQYKTRNSGLSIWLASIFSFLLSSSKNLRYFYLRVRSFCIFYYKIKNFAKILDLSIHRFIVYILTHCRPCNRRGRGINNMLLTGVRTVDFESLRVLRELNAIILIFIFLILFYSVGTMYY